ncbi:MAG: hypothetical protein Q7N50_04765 [Armatimonadota bacterium]|nr:hypothetical protein [Armatimonadota bacterium]
MLSLSQRATLKTFILNDPTLAAQAAAEQFDLVMTALNANASPDFWVWRTSVSKNEITQETSQDGTVFNWTGTGFITRSQGERDAWSELFVDGIVNPSLVNVRQAFNDIFSGGTPPAPANRAHLLAVARRKASVLERIFTTGTGSTAAPATLVVQGQIGEQEISDTMRGV